MKYLILGNGDYSKMLRRYLCNTKNIDIDGFTVAQSAICDKIVDGKQVISMEEIADFYSPVECRIFLGIGYRNMNQIKQNEFLRYKNMGYTFENYIHPTAIIDDSAEIGEGNNIFEGVIIQEGVKIGDANLIYGGAMVAHESTVGDYNSLSVKACVAGCTQIGNNCFIGANSTVRDHVIISDYSLVGAGAYVDMNTSPYDVVVPQKAMILPERKSVEFI